MLISSALNNDVVVSLCIIFESDRVSIDICQNWLLNAHSRPVGIGKFSIPAMSDMRQFCAKLPTLKTKLIKVAA